MPEQPGAGRLDPETLAAYVDGLLPPEERAKVEAEIATDPETYEWVVNAVNAVEDESIADTADDASSHRDVPASDHGADGPVVPRKPADGKDTPARVLPFMRRRSVQGVLGTLLAVAAALVVVVRTQPVWWQSVWGPAVDPRFAKLVQSVGEERYIEARLTGVAYSPLLPVARGGGRSSNLSLLAAAGELEGEAKRSPSQASLQAWGVAQLLVGDHAGGVTGLEKASSYPGAPASAYSDLAAAYLARSAFEDRADDLPRALDSAQRALSLQPEMLEARFNRALALTALNLKGEARKAWADYLAADAGSPWAAEARAQLARLDVPARGANWPDDRARILSLAKQGPSQELNEIGATYPQQIREMVEDELLPSWGADVNLRPEESAASLEPARTLALLLRDLSGERLPLDAVTSAQRAANTPAQAVLATGLQLFGVARKLYEATRIGESMPQFAAAKRSLDEGNSPLSLLCAHHLAIGEFYKGRHDANRSAQRRLLAKAQSSHYRHLEARAHWMLGLSFALEAEHALELEHYKLALSAFERLGEAGNVAAVSNLMSSAYLYMGDHRAAWLHAARGLSEMGPLMPPRRRHTQLVNAANSATRGGWPGAALAFAEEALNSAPAWNVADGWVEGHHYRAKALAQLGHPNEALADLDTARAYLPAVLDDGIRGRLSAELAQTEAEASLTVDPQRSTSAATSAIQFFSTTRAFLRVPRLHLIEARALKAMGRAGDAEVSLRTALTSFMDERQTLPAFDDSRLSHFDEIWNASHELLELMSASGASASALFQVAEQGKARTLTEARSASAAGSVDWLTPERVMAALPVGQALVYYAVLEHEVLAWVVTASGSTLHRLQIERGRLESEVEACLETLRASNDCAEQGRVLHATLIEPLLLSESLVTRIAISADGILHRLPFAVLPEPQRGRHLVERFVLSSAPSAGFFLNHMGLRHPSGHGDRVLAVGVGAAVAEPRLPALPEAEAEATEVATAFAGKALVGNAATVEQLAAALPGATVLHIAGHAVANPEYPGLSRLFLSDGGGGTTPLFAKDLHRLNLSDVQLAVLSGCGTLDGASRNGEGVASLARTFLLAGVPAVIGSLWDVGDAATRQFVRVLYFHLSRTGDVAESLAAAQRDAIRRGERASSWSAWVVQKTL